MGMMGTEYCFAQCIGDGVSAKPSFSSLCYVPWTLVSQISKMLFGVQADANENSFDILTINIYVPNRVGLRGF